MAKVPLALVLVAAASGAQPRWELVSSSAKPVITREQALPHGVYQGFETGQYLKVNGTHYYVANELGFCPSVVWDHTTRAALWSAPSSQGPWRRVTTLRDTNSMHKLCGLPAGQGLKDSMSWAPTLLFAPSPVNGSKPVWQFFYSGGEAARFQPGDGIVQSVSTTDSIEGPYVDIGLSLQSSHSFTAWQLPNRSWVGFRNNVPGAKSFSVGLMRTSSSQSLGGWEYDGNSVPFPCGPENPIVTRSMDGRWYYAAYDALTQLPEAGSSNEKGCAPDGERKLCSSKTECDKIGLAWSPDGVTWTAEATALVRVQVDGEHPCGQIRTPFGLVAVPELCAGCYSVLWSGFSTERGTDHNGYEPVCQAVIRQVNEENSAGEIVV